MECRACTDSLSAFLDDELPSPERQSVERHISECSGCRDELESLHYSVRLTDALPSAETTGLWSRIEAEITPVPVAAESKPGLAELFARFLWPAAAMAAAALAILLGVPLLMQPEYPDSFQTFLKERELRYQQHVRTFLASDFDFHRGSSNPFIRRVSHDGSNPFR